MFLTHITLVKTARQVHGLKSTGPVIRALSSLWIILPWKRFREINKQRANLTIHGSAVFGFGIIAFPVAQSEKIIKGWIIFGIINMLCSSMNWGQPSPFQQFWRIYLSSAAVGKAYWISWKPWDKNTQCNTWTLGYNCPKLILSFFFGWMEFFSNTTCLLKHWKSLSWRLSGPHGK